MKKEIERKYCKKCGIEIFDDTKYCSNCGIKLKMVRKTKNRIDCLPLIIASIITIVLCFSGVYLYSKYYFKSKVIETVKIVKDVTITDTGLAEAVDKVYDSVVVVENYVKDSLSATGTGFVYKTDDKNGYIITNNHVVDGATEVYVVFTNNKRIKTEVLGTDEYQDMAVLRVDKSDVISVATIGKTESLRVGDTTFAVGAPIDSSVYSWTVTRGILSGKNRVVEYSISNNFFNSTSYVIEVLQTDTAINSGNSGGPLCNANGEVIGVTNMKIASESVEGMAFALPIENVIKYADKFINGEIITRPYLGITMYDVTISRTNKSRGIYINSIEKDSSVSKSELKVGDVITKIDGVIVESSIYLKYELYKHNVGDTIIITYIRDEKEYEASVVLGSNNKTT